MPHGRDKLLVVCFECDVVDVCFDATVPSYECLCTIGMIYISLNNVKFQILHITAALLRFVGAGGRKNDFSSFDQTE